MRWAAKRQPESVQPVHDELVARDFEPTRIFAQNPLTDFCVDGEKLCSCHSGTLNAALQT
jgi:hypothetical protein